MTTDALPPIESLEGLILALRNARGALSSQSGQIGQMKGMFGDEDGTIAEALEAGDDSWNELAIAIAYAELLIAKRDFDVATQGALEAAAEERAAMIAEALDDAGIRKIPVPTVEDLHAAAERVEAMIRETAIDEDGEGDLQVSTADAIGLSNLLVGAALGTRLRETPAEVVVTVHGGVVQHVATVAGQPPVTIYVKDTDLDSDADPSSLATLKEENRAFPDYQANLSAIGADALPTDGPTWTSVRSEIARLASDDLDAS
jgi:hypothetical protein